MKKSRKAICSLILLMLVAMSLATRAFADAPSITFQGFSKGFDFQPGSEYTETDLFGNFKNLMPGDTVTETITFTNAATDCDFVNLYMRAEAHSETANPLSPKVAEEETLATMTEFLSQLSMKVWNGTELIYEASPDELDGLKSNKLLGVFRTGQSATLKVQLSPLPWITGLPTGWGRWTGSSTWRPTMKICFPSGRSGLTATKTIGMTASP